MIDREEAKGAKILWKEVIKNGFASPIISSRSSFLRGSIFPLVPTLLFLAIFFFIPLTRILALGLFPENWSLITVHSLNFTLYQASLSTLFTFALGLPAAWLFARYEFRGKAILRALTAVPFLLPTVVVAAGFNALLGPRGLSSFIFPLSSFQFTGTLTAIVVAHVFYNSTIVIRILGNALTNLDPRLEQAARTLGASPFNTWMRITLPLLRPHILSAALLVFLFNFTSFGVILLLGGPQFSTLETEIYVQALQMLNLPMAALLSIIQLLCTFSFSILYYRLAAQSTFPTTPQPATPRRAKNLREKILLSSFIFLLSSFFILPLLSLPLRSITRLEADRGQRGAVTYGFTIDYYRELFINRRGSVFYVPPLEAARNSLTYAAATVLLSLGLGLPAARALSRSSRATKIFSPLITLPLGASAITLGLGYLITFNKPLTQNWSLITDHWLLKTENWSLLTSPLIIPLAHTVIALPFVIRILQPALASIPTRLRDAATVLGASPSRVWRSVDWPILSRAVLASAGFAFTISLGEFGAATLLSRPAFPTLPVAIARFLSQPGGLNYGQAMAMSTILMTITLLAILLIEKMRLPGSKDF